MQRKVPARRCRLGRVAVGLIAWLAVAGAEPPIALSDPWIREAPPGAAMLAGYFELHNGTGGPLVLEGARSARFAAVELHESRIEAGVARMRPLGRIEIAPDAGLQFAPGGRHLMLMHPVAAVRAGDCIPVTLLFADGREVEVRFEVRKE